MASNDIIKPISADSHVTEPPSCYADYLEPKWRDKAPRLGMNADRGSIYLIDGLPGVLSRLVERVKAKLEELPE